MSLQFHLDFISIYFDVTSIPLRFHLGFTSISCRVHFNLTLASLKKGPGPTATGDQRHRGNQRDPQSPSKNKGQPLYTPQNPCREHQGSSIISQNSFLFDFAKRKRARNPKGTGTDPPDRPGALMTINSPATGSRTPLRFPGLSKPPTSDF